MSEGHSPRPKLDALNDAIHAVTTEINLESVLRRLAEISAHLVNARYAALGVPNDSGGLLQFFTYGMSEKQVARMDHLPIGIGLLRELLHQPDPIRLEDMTKDSRSKGFCPYHPRMTSFLGVPIVSRGVTLGSLYLSDRLDNRPFTEDDERLITMLAGHAAVAIENARLNDQLRRLAIIEERDRIAMELHDGIIQQIYAAGIKLDIARLTHAPNPELDEQMQGVTGDLNRIIEDLRRYIRDLNKGVGYAVTLSEQLKEVFDGFRSMSTARLVTDVQSGLTHLTEDKVHILTQITREALSNIVRHSGANEVYVELQDNGTALELVISDNGKGFDPQTVTRGHGLNNMAMRSEAANGALSLESTLGHGATIRAILPH